MTPLIVLKHAPLAASTPSKSPDTADAGTTSGPLWNVTINNEHEALRHITVLATSKGAAHLKALEQLADSEWIGAIAAARSVMRPPVVNSRQPGRRPFVATIAVGAAIALGACSAAPQGDLATNKRTLASCPSSPLASQAAIDVSGTVRAGALPAPYGAAVQDLARRTAVCGGHLSVVAFSASSAATVSLYDGDLQMHGSTENARLRRVPQAVEEVMKSVGEGYATKVSGLTAGGTDVVAQYRLVGEYANQLGGNRQLELLLLTDGFQSAGTMIGEKPLSSAEAASLADRFDLPQLPGATITVAGIGKTNDPQPASTEVVDGLKAFYTAICERTGAATCVTVTDYIAAGG